MIRKVDTVAIRELTRRLINTGLDIGEAANKAKRKPIYPTPSGMNIKIPKKVMLDGNIGFSSVDKAHADDFSTLSYIENYTKPELQYCPESQYEYSLVLKKSGRRPAFGYRRNQKLEGKIGEEVTPVHFDYRFPTKPCYYIDELWTTGKNSGTNAVKAVVLKSLKDSETKGRVMLYASNIDGKTSPVGFYYKLGFRSIYPSVNEDCAKWLATGGKRELAPRGAGIMYLPEENVQHCLNYGLNIPT